MKKKMKKFTGMRGKYGQWKTDFPQLLVGPLHLINNNFPKCKN